MSHQLTHFSNKQLSMKPFATMETNESKTASLMITKQALTIPDISRHLTQHSWANSNVVTKSKAILHDMNDTTGKHTGPEAFCKSSTAMQPKEQENQECREVLTICLQTKTSNFETDRNNLTLTVLKKDCCSHLPTAELYPHFKLTGKNICTGEALLTRARFLPEGANGLFC